MSVWTPLQLEVRAMERKLWAEQKAALARCKNEKERDMCWNAYNHLSYCHLDIIRQRHGMSPLTYSVKS